MKIFILPVGKTAALVGAPGKKNILETAHESFQFDAAIMFASKEMGEEIAKIYTNELKCRAGLVTIENAFYGAEDYQDAVAELVVVAKSIGEASDTEIIVNTSGGTEKMSCIVRDCGNVLAALGYKVTSVFGVFNKTINGVIYTTRPQLSEVINHVKAVVAEDPVLRRAA